MRKRLCHLQTLSGHTSPVEYVKFNSGEDLVIAGSQSGTLKIWDLEAAKSKLNYNYGYYQVNTHLKLCSSRHRPGLRLC